MDQVNRAVNRKPPSALAQAGSRATETLNPQLSRRRKPHSCILITFVSRFCKLQVMLYVQLGQTSHRRKDGGRDPPSARLPSEANLLLLPLNLQVSDNERGATDLQWNPPSIVNPDVLPSIIIQHNTSRIDLT